jgi:hypothetical protein
VAGLAARIVFWAATNRRFEDALITIKHAKNFANGHGLVHHLGEGHVQGFTSAVSVLIPIPGELIAGDAGAFAAMRLASLVAFIFTAIYAYRIAQDLELSPWPTGFVLAYLALDQNQVFYGMSGMETQIAVAILLAGIHYVMRGDFVRSGIALGLAPLVRPDFVLWLAPAYVFLFLRSRRETARAAAVTAAIVTPWVLFTTFYYGSPIPNTIRAKSMVVATHFPTLTDAGGWVSFFGDHLQLHHHDWTFLAPFLEKVFVGETPLPHVLLKIFAFVIIGLAICGALWTWRRASWRPAIAFLLLYVTYVFLFQPVSYFQWYYQPPLAVVILLAAAGIDRLAMPRRTAAAVAATSAAVLYSIQLPFTIPLDTQTQHDIEDRVRQPLGRYLERVVRPGQTYASESSGYVGFFTNATLYDYPGLTSSTVVDTFRRIDPANYNLQTIVHLLRPDWVVLRPNEWDTLGLVYPKTTSKYHLSRTFRAPVSATPLEHWHTAIGNIDREFAVYRRRQ